MRDALGSWGEAALAIAAIFALLAIAWKIVQWAVRTADKLENINKAVNHQPKGTPPIAMQITEINQMIQPLAERMQKVADEADRKHDDNQALIAGLAAEVERLNQSLGTIRRALGMHDEPWNPSMGDRRRR
jgi:HAMP domain-containing protein